MQTFIKIFLIVTVLLLSNQGLLAQVTQNEVKATLILRLCENITWEKPFTGDIVIGCYTDSKTICNILKPVVESIKIQKKKIVVKQVKSKEEILSCHAIYYNKSNKNDFLSILEYARNNNILLISDNMEDLLFVMIDIKNIENKISFHVNMPNLSLSGFTIKPNLLLSGGRMVDIKLAYEKFEAQINQNKQNLNKIQEELRNNEELITQKDIELQEKEIKLAEKEKKIIGFSHKITSYIEESDSLKASISKEQNLLQRKNRENKKQSLELQEIYSSIKEKQIDLDKLNQNIVVLKDESDTLKAQITNKNTTLTQQEKFISGQRSKLLLSIIFIGALLIAASTLIYLFFMKRKNNLKLATANQELFEKNIIINDRNSELKTTMQHLKTTQSNLVQSEKMASLGVLTAGVAHEINNPLNYIMGGYIGLDRYFKENKTKDEDIPILLESIKVGIDRASEIVKGLNQFSRDDEFYNEDCNIHSILNNSITMLNSQFKNKIQLTKNYFTESVIVIGNVGKLHQVFINTLTNASHAIEKEGKITITTNKLGNTFFIEIADTGSGISQENLTKITDPFFTTKAAGKGTGLGLSITYTIIKDHKGKLEFESNMGKGTKVTISLPVKNE